MRNVPWQVVAAHKPIDGELDYAIVATLDGQRIIIAEVYGRVGEDIRLDAKANAALISASRELLQAVEFLLEKYPVGPLVREGMDALIAKAKGEEE